MRENIILISVPVDRFSPESIFCETRLAQQDKQPPHSVSLLHLITGNQAGKKQLAHLLSFAMPSQSVATCASREAIFRQNAAVFVSLDDVVNLPVTSEVAIAPSALAQVHRVATEMTMAFSFSANLSQFGFGHARSLLNPHRYVSCLGFMRNTSLGNDGPVNRQ